MTLEYKALSTLVRGLNASTMDLEVHDHIQKSLSAGSVSGAELLAYSAHQENRLSDDDYNALMFAFEHCDDIVKK